MDAQFVPRFRFALLPLALSASAALASQEGPLPAGAGKQTVEKVCTGCHEIDTVITARHTVLDWQEMAQDMPSRGPGASDEDLAAIVGYLTRFFGKINVNIGT